MKKQFKQHWKNSLQRFRNNLKLRASVLGILGTALLITALYVQLPAWLGARYQRKRQLWKVMIPIDCNTTNTYKEKFQATESLIGNPKLQMYGPLLTEFNKTHIAGENVPTKIFQDFFSKSSIDFSISWKILEGDKTFDSGVFSPNDVVAWSYPDHVYYKVEDFSGHRHVDTEKDYSVIIDIKQPCQALSKLKPFFTLGPSPMMNLISISNNLLKITVPIFILGVFILVIAFLKYKYATIKKKSISPVSLNVYDQE